uniref:Integrase, catalytic region, zinc finger, CCHC-type, peptidase aspartic, catalytic n=1 Tax=Tanacetum cinerariifolium TaxID=118510 RepID=A0A6L2M0T8_TANCI|nr:hypothetical protein [Tanacetum cinerariifolium]
MSNTNTNLQTQTSNALNNAIMEAGGKDRPPMLAPGNYVQWKSRTKRYIDTKPNNELIHYYLQNPPYKFKWTEKTISVAKGSSETTTEGYMKNYKNVSQDIRNQLDAEAEQHKNKVNEIRAERLARTANPLVLVAQQPVYHPQNHPITTLKILQLNHNKLLPKIEQADWRDDTDDEPGDLELEGHYMYMAQIQEVTLDVVDNSGPIFDIKPLQKVQSDDDNYNVFANDREHPEQPESINDTYLKEQGDINITIDSLDMSTNGETIDHDDYDLAREHDLFASLIDKLKCEIDDSKNCNKLLESSNKTLVDKLKEEKEAQNKFYKTREDKEIKKVIALENKVKVLDNIVYKADQSVQTMNMLNRNCKTSFVIPEFLKKAQRANPCMYDIGCYNDNLAL